LWEEYVAIRKAEGQEAAESQTKSIYSKSRKFYRDNREAMDAGAVVNNPFRFDDTVMPDGFPKQLSTLQTCYDAIADTSEEAFETEYQNTPPEEEKPITTELSSYEIQRRLSAYPQHIVPPETLRLTAAIDVGKTACHWVAVAWRGDASGFIIDYGVEEKASDDAIDAAIYRALHQWRHDTAAGPFTKADGEIVNLNLCLIDSGYRPNAVYNFCRESGSLYRPAKGFGESGDGGGYSQPRKSTPTCKAGDRWKLSQQQAAKLWLVEMDTNHWKRWTMDRFRVPMDGTTPQPGGLCLFEHDKKARRQQHLAISKHLTSEREVEEFVRGKGIIKRWEKVRRSNHWFDAVYMASVAASMCGIKLLSQRKKPKAKRVKLSELQQKRRRQ
jgi:phage terminase large subunit GpA-like protein